MSAAVSVPSDVRAAIRSFLNESQGGDRPFTLSDAMSAVRHIFPDLEVSDTDLADAITSEALTAGLNVDFDVPLSKNRSLDRWDNEGGAIRS